MQSFGSHEPSESFWNAIGDLFWESGFWEWEWENSNYISLVNVTNIYFFNFCWLQSRGNDCELGFAELFRDSRCAASRESTYGHWQTARLLGMLSNPYLLPHSISEFWQLLQTFRPLRLPITKKFFTIFCHMMRIVTFEFL